MRDRSIVVGLAFLGVIAGIAIFFAPLPRITLVSPLALRLYIAVLVSYALFHFEAVWLFLRGSRYFKKELRRAYVILCGGLLLLAAAQLQQPIVGT